MAAVSSFGLRFEITLRMILFGILLFICAGGMAPDVSRASMQTKKEEGSRTIWDGVYGSAQAKRGHDSYMDSCVECHAEDLSGDSPYNPAPAVAGKAFMLRWDNRTVDELFSFIRTEMPKGKPTTLKDETYIDVISYILQFNKVPPGEKELVADHEELKKIVILKEKKPDNQ
jgi:cytochrome c